MKHILVDQPGAAGWKIGFHCHDQEPEGQKLSYYTDRDCLSTGPWYQCKECQNWVSDWVSGCYSDRNGNRFCPECAKAQRNSVPAADPLRASVPKPFAMATVDDLTAKQIKTEWRGWLKWWPKDPNILVFGGTGVGKTHCLYGVPRAEMLARFE